MQISPIGSDTGLPIRHKDGTPQMENRLICSFIISHRQIQVDIPLGKTPRLPRALGVGVNSIQCILVHSRHLFCAHSL